MESLIHNGILVLEPPESQGLSLVIRGETIPLTRLQEEMAIAWVRKLGTPYVEDPIFINNFLADFSKELGINPVLSLSDIDFSDVIEFVEAERARKEVMTKEEKKATREARKIERERLKEKFGYVVVDNERMELSNYQTEPSGIFMGRGEHPIRGKWKKGARHQDITLNLSPDAPRPEGDWHDIIWVPDTMWIAKWTDELTGKTKYIWLHDSTPIKQEREATKFDKALRLGRKEAEIQTHILDGLHSNDSKRRMVAAACYLIDRLSLRVGDEKDPEEADTVGATTLRAEHVSFKGNTIVFDFLGKDSVAWHKELDLEQDVFLVFKELYDKAVERLESFRSRTGMKTKGDPKKAAQIFPAIRSTHVNRFLSEIDKDLTAKVFRTYHATHKMQEELRLQKVKKTDYEFIKKAAFKRANLEVARVMNHTKQEPKGWSKTSVRYQERLKKADVRIAKVKKMLDEKRKRLRAFKKKENALMTAKKEAVSKAKARVEREKSAVMSWREKRDKAKAVWDSARSKRRKLRESGRKGKRSKKERMEEAQERVSKIRATLDRAEESLAKARMRYEKSKESLQRAQDVLAIFREKSSQRVAKSNKIVATAKERMKKAEAAKEKIKTDFQLAKAGRTWNLGTSLKSYIHPKIVYRWCQRVEYDWKRVYPATLQRKFAWVEN